MKVKVFMLSLVVVLTAFVAQAQGVPQVDNRPAYKVEFEQDPAAHWFAELRGGAAMLSLDSKANGEAKFVNRISPITSLSLGRWHSPYSATRLRSYAWNVYSFDKLPSAAEVTRYQNFFEAVSLELMFDLADYFAPYRENRVLHPVPSAGLGGYMKFYSVDDKSGDEFGMEDDYSGLLNGGPALEFRLGRRVDFNFECQTMISKNNFQGTYTVHQPADVAALVSAGLAFKLSKVEFQPVTPVDYDLVNDPNGQISSLRAQNAELSKCPVSCPECPEAAPAETSAVIENAVTFRVGSAKIGKNQIINVYNSAEAAKANGGKIYIAGYADEQTGNVRISTSLFQRRVEIAKEALVNKYGVNPDNIVIDYKGDTVRPFVTNEWNCVAIIDIR